jgi:DNA-binding transcriptional LysR family regulator
MNSFYDPMDLIADLFEPLTRPNHGITSVAQLCKIKRIPEDFGRRNVAKAEERFRGRLTQVENHRLTLNDKGRRVWNLALQERAVAENGEGAIETLTVECASYVAEATFFTRAISEFVAAFGGLVRLRICNLEAASVRQNIAGHITDFALGLVDDDDGRSGIEPLEARVSAVLGIPVGHRLQNGVGPVSGSDLQPEDRLFISPDALTLPGLHDWLQGVASGNRLEFDSHALIRRCAATGLGLGVSLCVDGKEMTDGLKSRLLAGVNAQPLCFYLPRRAAELSEHATALVDVIRKHQEIPKNLSQTSTEPTTPSIALSIADGEIDKSPITSLEETNS